jgi:hypothetical protein
MICVCVEHGGARVLGRRVGSAQRATFIVPCMMRQCPGNVQMYG